MSDQKQQGRAVSISLRGMVRNTAGTTSPDGEMDELVNLRFKDGHFVPVNEQIQPTGLIDEYVPYSYIFIHSNEYQHLLGVLGGKVFYFGDIDNDNVVTLLREPVALTSVDVTDAVGVQYTQTGNLVTVLDGGKLQYLYWRKTQYVSLAADYNGGESDESLAPEGKVEFRVVRKQYKNSGFGTIRLTRNNEDLNGVKNFGVHDMGNQSGDGAELTGEIIHGSDEKIEYLKKTAIALMEKSRAYSRKKGEPTGYFYVCTALKLYDGSYILQSRPLLMKPANDYYIRDDIRKQSEDGEPAVTEKILNRDKYYLLKNFADTVISGVIYDKQSTNTASESGEAIIDHYIEMADDTNMPTDADKWTEYLADNAIVFDDNLYSRVSQKLEELKINVIQPFLKNIPQNELKYGIAFTPNAGEHTAIFEKIDKSGTNFSLLTLLFFPFGTEVTFASYAVEDLINAGASSFNKVEIKDFNQWCNKEPCIDDLRCFVYSGNTAEPLSPKEYAPNNHRTAHGDAVAYLQLAILPADSALLDENGNLLPKYKHSAFPAKDKYGNNVFIFVYRNVVNSKLFDPWKKNDTNYDSYKYMYCANMPQKLQYKINSQIDKAYEDIIESVCVFITKEVEPYWLQDGKSEHSVRGRVFTPHLLGGEIANGLQFPWEGYPNDAWHGANFYPVLKTQSEVIDELEKNSVFYLAHEIKFADFKPGQWVDIDLEKDGILENLVADIAPESTLEVDASDRNGYSPKASLMYNGRLHIANYKEEMFRGFPLNYFFMPTPVGKNTGGGFDRTDLMDGQYPTTAKTISTLKSQWAEILNRRKIYQAWIEVDIETNEGISTVRRTVPCSAEGFTLNNLNPLISYPDIRAKEMRITYCNVRVLNGSTYVLEGIRNVFELKPHPTYDFAYYLDPDLRPIDITEVHNTDKPRRKSMHTNTLPPKSESDFEKMLNDENALLSLVGKDTTSSVEFKPNALRVSLLDNPMVFPSKTFYQVGNQAIIALATNSLVHQTGQEGDAPLYVLAHDGVYGLFVDASGQLVYSNSRPIARDICNNWRSVTYTDMGVCFSTDRGIINMNGLKAVDISDAIEGAVCDFTNVSATEFMKVARAATSHRQLTTLTEEHAFDNVNFLEYVKGCIIGYNYRLKELWISNPQYPYSYVLMNGMWGKVMVSCDQYINNYPETLMLRDNQLRFLGRENESGNAVALLTRPVKYSSEQFKQTYRAILRCYLRMLSKPVSVTLTAEELHEHLLPYKYRQNVMLYTPREVEVERYEPDDVETLTLEKRAYKEVFLSPEYQLGAPVPYIVVPLKVHTGTWEMSGETKTFQYVLLPKLLWQDVRVLFYYELDNAWHIIDACVEGRQKDSHLDSDGGVLEAVRSEKNNLFVVGGESPISQPSETTQYFDIHSNTEIYVNTPHHDGGEYKNDKVKIKHHTNLGGRILSLAIPYDEYHELYRSIDDEATDAVSNDYGLSTSELLDDNGRLIRQDTLFDIYNLFTVRLVAGYELSIDEQLTPRLLLGDDYENVLAEYWHLQNGSEGNNRFNYYEIENGKRYRFYGVEISGEPREIVSGREYVEAIFTVSEEDVSEDGDIRASGTEGVYRVSNILLTNQLSALVNDNADQANLLLVTVGREYLTQFVTLEQGTYYEVEQIDEYGDDSVLCSGESVMTGTMSVEEFLRGGNYRSLLRTRTDTLPVGGLYVEEYTHLILIDNVSDEQDTHEYHLNIRVSGYYTLAELLAIAEEQSLSFDTVNHDEGLLLSVNSAGKLTINGTVLTPSNVDSQMVYIGCVAQVGAIEINPENHFYRLTVSDAQGTAMFVCDYQTVGNVSFSGTLVQWVDYVVRHADEFRLGAAMETYDGSHPIILPVGVVIEYDGAWYSITPQSADERRVEFDIAVPYDSFVSAIATLSGAQAPSSVTLTDVRDGRYTIERTEEPAAALDGHAGLYVFGSYDARRWQYLGGQELTGTQRDIGTTVNRTDCKYFRVLFTAFLSHDSSIEYLDTSVQQKLYNGKLR